MKSRSRLFVSVLLVLLLLSSVTVPVAAKSSPAPFIAAAAPAMVPIIIESVEVVFSSVLIVEIGAQLGKNWDGITENFDNFASDIGKAIDNLVSSKKWIDATSNEGKTLLKIEHELCASGGSRGPDKDKWYHEAKRENDTVKINTERISEKEAGKKINEGKDVFTLNEDLGKKVAERAIRQSVERKGLSDAKIQKLVNKKIGKSEIHKGGKPGYYPHYHIDISGHRIHIWWDRAL